MMLAGAVRAADNEPRLPPGASVEDTNAMQTLRSYLQLQEQLHATQMAIEENRKEATAAAARSAEALANRLQAIEQSLAAQRSRELEATQSSNRMILSVAAGIAVLGLVSMLLMAFSHWRAMSRLADIATALPMSRAGLGSGASFAALGSGEPHVVALGPGTAEESSGRLLGVIDRLEKRIYELEHTTQSSVKDQAAEDSKPQNPSGNGETSAKAAGDAGEISMLLGKGQSLVSLDRVDDALDCFEQVLALDPDHAEALVKKGNALERLRRFDEAIECYDRAISRDSSMTVAYLHKGGLYNRMERYTEALECYEKALKTQERRG
jgi:tetratricopeptide (TPR) repeat protein